MNTPVSKELRNSEVLLYIYIYIYMYGFVGLILKIQVIIRSFIIGFFLLYIPKPRGVTGRELAHIIPKVKLCMRVCVYLVLGL